MNIEIIKDELSNKAYKELVEAILETVLEVKSGKKKYHQGIVELSGYKQIIQLMALEMMKAKVQINGDYRR